MRIDVVERSSSFLLVVSGPGRRRRSIECRDRWAVIEEQIAQEARLLATGYVLERTTIDPAHAPGDLATQPAKIFKARGRSRS